MYAALHSEQTKFFSFGWCILGIFGAVVVPLFYLLTLNVPKTGGEKEILSLCLQALYLGHPGVIVASAAYFGQEYSNSALRTTLLTQPSRLKIACVKFLNNALIIVITGIVAIVLCLLVLLIQHDMKWSSAYELIITERLPMSILSWIQIALITAALSVITKSLIVPLAIMLPLMLGLSHMFFTISQSAKFLPTLATMNFFSIPESTVFLEKWSGLGVQFIWALLLVISSTFIFSHRNVR
ncbi:MAG TPA: ABC transporter permease [Paenibacillus sp.]|uniref:ABC transporter permease n=1 Tax=Paenibacillus TaxID=44249 RepID=UPI000BA10C08|nr:MULTISPECIES: ABC transporter permease [Paenibacillus]OZQ60572.1 ABC transporter permease [Paenibacillus taichungensis]HBU81001.1 ABC transporter permease [Paenibacillus sp.]